VAGQCSSLVAGQLSGGGVEALGTALLAHQLTQSRFDESLEIHVSDKKHVSPPSDSRDDMRHSAEVLQAMLPQMTCPSSGRSSLAMAIPALGRNASRPHLIPSAEAEPYHNTESLTIHQYEDLTTKPLRESSRCRPLSARCPEQHPDWRMAKSPITNNKSIGLHIHVKKHARIHSLQCTCFTGAGSCYGRLSRST
jgi:hypothetical protein